MPLSEQEQRLLDEMERNLYHNDADYVATVGSRQGRPSYTILILGILAALAGIAVLVVGVALRQPVVGLLGFAAMFGGVLLAVAPPRRFRAAIDARSARRATFDDFGIGDPERRDREGRDS